MYTLTIAGERLMAMYDNEMDVYATPGAHESYWASSPQFRYDVCVATASEIIEQVCMDHGLDEDDLRTMEEEIEYEVELVPAREENK